MRRQRKLLAGACALAALLAGGCTEQHGIMPGTVAQTKFPGQLAAGGLGSGEVMQRTKQATTSSMPSGTPGIPGGAGGNTSGPGMGGTTPNAAVAGEAPKGKMQGETPVSGDPARAAAANAGPTRPPGESAGAIPATGAATPAAAPAPGSPEQVEAAKAEAAKAEAARKAAAAQKEKEELVASMDDVTRRWRADAAKNDWPTHPPTPVAGVAGINASNAQEQNRSATPPPVRSEKQGDAPPSEDVKKPKEPGAK